MKEQEPKPGEQEIIQTAEVLGKLEGGDLPLPIFKEVTKLTVTPAYELVPFRISDERKTEILLIRRPDDDLWRENFTI